jgi:hypothetical protein
MALGPSSFSRSIAFCVAGLEASVADRISVTSRSARKFVKKLIQLSVAGSSCMQSSAPFATEQVAQWVQACPGPASRCRDAIY